MANQRGPDGRHARSPRPSRSHRGAGPGEVGRDRRRCGAQRARCAAYLAKAGKRVLVLEARERVGGACTLEEVWPGFKVSPCAYLVGLLHPLVIDELDLAARGFAWMPASAGMFVPFEDGSSIQLWDDDDRCEAEIRDSLPAISKASASSATSSAGSATPCVLQDPAISGSVPPPRASGSRAS